MIDCSLYFQTMQPHVNAISHKQALRGRPTVCHRGRQNAGKPIPFIIYVVKLLPLMSKPLELDLQSFILVVKIQVSSSPSLFIC